MKKHLVNTTNKPRYVPGLGVINAGAFMEVGRDVREETAQMLAQTPHFEIRQPAPKKGDKE